MLANLFEMLSGLSVTLSSPFEMLSGLSVTLASPFELLLPRIWRLSGLSGRFPGLFRLAALAFLARWPLATDRSTESQSKWAVGHWRAVRRLFRDEWLEACDKCYYFLPKKSNRRMGCADYCQEVDHPEVDHKRLPFFSTERYKPFVARVDIFVQIS